MRNSFHSIKLDDFFVRALSGQVGRQLRDVVEHLGVVGTNLEAGKVELVFAAPVRTSNPSLGGKTEECESKPEAKERSS